MTQEELARAVGMSPNALARFERGESGDVKAHILGKIAPALVVSTDWLLGMPPDDQDAEADSPLKAKKRPRRRAAVHGEG